MWCIDDIGEEAVKAKFEAMIVGPNRQPCQSCGKMVKAEYCFCHVCGKILCDAHTCLTSDVGLSELRG